MPRGEGAGMKLLLCLRCHDVVALQRTPRFCLCAHSHGQYVSNSNVAVEGPCRVIGLPNGIRYGLTARVEAFVIAEPNEIITRRGQGEWNIEQPWPLGIEGGRDEA